jgi:hypothetical protein
VKQETKLIITMVSFIAAFHMLIVAFNIAILLRSNVLAQLYSYCVSRSNIAEQVHTAITHRPQLKRMTLKSLIDDLSRDQ